MIASGGALARPPLAGPADFRAAISQLVDKATKDASNVVQGKDGWLFFVPELHHLSVSAFWGDAAAKVSKAANPAYADPLPAILDFKSQLDKKGITLLVVPVPAKASIYPDKLVDGAANTAEARLDSADAEFLQMLKGDSIPVIDLTPDFLAYRSAHPANPLYCQEDTHWSGYGIALATDRIAKAIQAQSWLSGVEKAKLTSAPLTITASGDLVTMLTGAKPAPERIALTKVTDAKGAVVTSWRESPVVLLGDSHNLIYSIGDDMLAVGSGLPENLAAKLGFAPDVVAVRGSGATPARVNLARRGDSLAGKRIVVWCFTVREFTEGQGWRKVPVIKP